MSQQTKQHVEGKKHNIFNNVMNISATFNLLIQQLKTLYILLYVPLQRASSLENLSYPVLPREQFGPLNPVPPQSHSLLTILFTHFPPLWHLPSKLGSLHASLHPGMVRSLFNKRARRNFLSPVANLGVFMQPSNLRENMSSWSLWNLFYLFALFPLYLFIIYLHIFHTGRIWKWRLFFFATFVWTQKKFKNRFLPKWWRQR